MRRLKEAFYSSTLLAITPYPYPWPSPWTIFYANVQTKTAPGA